jgi:hypothetical protein
MNGEFDACFSRGFRRARARTRVAEATTRARATRDVD